MSRHKEKRPGGYSAGPFFSLPHGWDWGGFYVLSPIVASCDVVVLPFAAALSSWNR